MPFKAFLLKHFWSPGYTVVNTLTYAIILFVCVYAIIEVLKKFGFRIDRQFFIATLPFVFFGSTARELVDRGFGVYPGYVPYPGNFFLVAPAIYFTMFFLTSLVFVTSIAFWGGQYHKPMLVFGSFFSSYNLYLIAQNIGNLNGLALAILSFSVSSILSYILIKRLYYHLLSLADSFKVNFLILLAHLLDASATFVGIDFMGFSEKHVLPNYLIEKIGSGVVMFPLKIFVVGLALYAIDREYAKDEVSRRFIKFVVLVLGLGPAIRDLTLIALG